MAITFAERRTALQGILASVKAMYDLNERASQLTTDLANSNAAITDGEINTVLDNLLYDGSTSGGLYALREEVVDSLQALDLETTYSST